MRDEGTLRPSRHQRMAVTAPIFFVPAVTPTADATFLGIGNATPDVLAAAAAVSWNCRQDGRALVER